MILVIDNNNNMLFYEHVMRKWKDSYNLVSMFLTFSDEKDRYLKDQNINSICLKNIESKSINAKELISNIEKKFDEFTLNQCIANDRILSHYSFEKASNILLDYAGRFSEVLKKNEIKLVCGEISWGVEYLFNYICRYNEIKYIDPLNVYASSDLRLTFFDEKHSDLYMNEILESANSVIDVQGIVEDRKNNDVNKKLGSKLRNLGYKSWFKKIKFLIKYKDKYDYRYDLLLKKKTIKKLLNKKLISLIKKVIYTDINLAQKFYYMPLHIQPEATPDIVSIFYNDQLMLIKQLAKALPIDTKLVVKEHPNGVGARSIKELNTIRNMNNVILSDHSYSSKSLIENALGVITIAGTAAIEARYMNKPVIVFSEIYFKNKLDHIYQCYNFNELPGLLNLFLVEKNFQETKINSFIEWIYTSSHDCYIYDPFIDENILLNENIKTFGKAVFDFYKKQ